MINKMYDEVESKLYGGDTGKDIGDYGLLGNFALGGLDASCKGGPFSGQLEDSDYLFVEYEGYHLTGFILEHQLRHPKFSFGYSLSASHAWTLLELLPALGAPLVVEDQQLVHFCKHDGKRFSICLDILIKLCDTPGSIDLREASVIVIGVVSRLLHFSLDFVDLGVDSTDQYH
jgi:hypothetical protein